MPHDHHRHDDGPEFHERTLRAATAIVRLSDPTECFHGEGGAATGTPYEELGRAVAYASPIYLDPGADASAEAMRREQIAGIR